MLHRFLVNGGVEGAGGQNIHSTTLTGHFGLQENKKEHQNNVRVNNDSEW